MRFIDTLPPDTDDILDEPAVSVGALDELPKSTYQNQKTAHQTKSQSLQMLLQLMNQDDPYKNDVL
ncbi:hypothetical protein ZHAS_00005477 [Anopheles sinensis]|uniref:Uncharacterized protein n=1 Tax=Anopheles sinensis TaxID=74873 RepID=A0A084VJM5_ANOSI|nr:hypothetical protein ZHAS_00005477 [Anopheles sinensis]